MYKIFIYRGIINYTFEMNDYTCVPQFTFDRNFIPSISCQLSPVLLPQLGFVCFEPHVQSSAIVLV